MTRHERVLAYVNRQRAKLGRRPLKKLPKGIVVHANRCPIATALCPNYSPAQPYKGYAEVDETTICVYDGKDIVIDEKPPKYVQKWITDFDNGLIPEFQQRFAA